MIINSTSFGSITIDNKTYNHDVWIFVDKTIQRRSRNHEFTLEEFNIITKGNPKILIIGTGQNGVVAIAEEVIKAAEEKNIELIYDITPAAIKKFNELNLSNVPEGHKKSEAFFRENEKGFGKTKFLQKDKKIAAAFHTTC